MGKLKLIVGMVAIIALGLSSFKLSQFKREPVDPVAQVLTETVKEPVQSEAVEVKSFHCRLDFSNGAALTEVEIAQTRQEMEEGYQNRTDTDNGMLFVWPTDEYRVFWSKNIIVPISIVFIDSTGSVQGIKEMGIKSEELIQSEVKAKYALEISRHMLNLLKIKVGSRVVVSECL